MSLQNWTENDTLTFIAWSANESINAIKTANFSDAELLQRGIVAIINIGQGAIIDDPRLNKWIDFRLSEISDPLRNHRTLNTEIQRTCILKSLSLLTNFIEGIPNVSTLAG